MYYEAGTTLKTHPDEPYDDGIRRIYLYAGGKLPEGAGETDRDLKRLLIYINESVEANAIDKVLVTELSRLGRDTLQVLEVIEMLNSKAKELPTTRNEKAFRRYKVLDIDYIGYQNSLMQAYSNMYGGLTG